MCGTYVVIANLGNQKLAYQTSSLLIHCLRLHPCSQPWCSTACTQVQLSDGCIATIGLGRCCKGNTGSIVRIPKMGNLSIITTDDISKLKLPKGRHDIHGTIKRLWKHGASGIAYNHKRKEMGFFAQPGGKLQQAKLPGITVISSFTINDWDFQWEAVEGVSVYQPDHSR